MDIRRNTTENLYYFLFYTGVIFIITFLQQEFVLLPEMNNLDVISDESKAKLLESWQKWRWLSFIIAPLMLLLRLSLVTLCLYVASFFFPNYGTSHFKNWWSISMRAQSIMLIYSVLLCILNISLGADKALDTMKFTSLMFLARENTEQWIKLPLSALNVFEFCYWCVLAFFTARESENKFWPSFKYVLSSYGVGYLFYIIFLMFLVLYLA